MGVWGLKSAPLAQLRRGSASDGFDRDTWSGRNPWPNGCRSYNTPRNPSSHRHRGRPVADYNGCASSKRFYSVVFQIGQSGVGALRREPLKAAGCASLCLFLFLEGGPCGSFAPYRVIVGNHRMHELPTTLHKAFVVHKGTEPVWVALDLFPELSPKVVQ